MELREVKIEMKMAGNKEYSFWINTPWAIKQILRDKFNDGL